MEMSWFAFAMVTMIIYSPNGDNSAGTLFFLALTACSSKGFSCLKASPFLLTANSRFWTLHIPNAPPNKLD